MKVRLERERVPMTPTTSHPRPSTVARLLFASLIFIVALNGLASAHAAMLAHFGAAPHSEVTVVTMAAHLTNTPEPSESIPSADSDDGPIHPNCRVICPTGCALGISCTVELGTLSGTSTANTTPTLSIPPVAALLDVDTAARTPPPARPPSLTALSISRI